MSIPFNAAQEKCQKIKHLNAIFGGITAAFRIDCLPSFFCVNRLVVVTLLTP